ncbi:MAG: zinc ribbon domain-containing protein [Staphylothermus sp.]|nr:zinc ribbon domain-containing protein [Staphylothermus sp.]
MATCPRCGRKVPEDAIYCPYCGARIGVTKENIEYIREKIAELRRAETISLIMAFFLTFCAGGMFALMKYETIVNPYVALIVGIVSVVGVVISLIAWIRAMTERKELLEKLKWASK